VAQAFVTFTDRAVAASLIGELPAIRPAEALRFAMMADDPFLIQAA